MHMHVCMHRCMNVCVHRCMNVCVHRCMHVCVHRCMHVLTSNVCMYLPEITWQSSPGPS